MFDHLENKKILLYVISSFYYTFFPFTYLSIAFAGENTLHPWGYEGGTGPNHWGELEKDHKKHLMCREGRNQSPINISDVRGSKLASLKFPYDAITYYCFFWLLVFRFPLSSSICVFSFNSEL